MNPVDVGARLGPEEALERLADQLRSEESVISPHVTDPSEGPALGILAAAGPRAAEAPDDYAVLIEAVREGYLLHYGRPRVVVGADPDLALLAGDYLYALGLRRLAMLGDLDAVRELSDLISLSAQLHAGGDRGVDEADALWLASVVAVAAGPSEGHERAKAALRERRADAATELLCEARHRAGQTGISAALERGAGAIGLDLSQLPDLG
jgi:hypothetical protein